MILQRRGFLLGAASLMAAPAIVRIENIMPVRAPRIILPSSAKAWVVLRGDGSTGPHSYGIADARRNGVGDWTLTFGSNFPPGYVASVMASSGIAFVDKQSSRNISIRVTILNGLPSDPQVAFVSVFGGT